MATWYTTIASHGQRCEGCRSYLPKYTPYYYCHPDKSSLCATCGTRRGIKATVSKKLLKHEEQTKLVERRENVRKREPALF